MRKHIIRLLFAGAACAATHGDTTFTRVTKGDIVNDPGQWVGAAWADFHHTGYLDLIVCDYAGLANAYYKNNGDGTFTKITQGPPVDNLGFHIYASPGDYNNDGNLDLFVTAGAYAPAATTNRFYLGNSDGTFTPAPGAGVTSQLGHYGAGVWADYDGDGFLDLFFANHGLKNDDGGKGQLFHNNGNGTFTPVTTGEIVQNPQVGFGATWNDYDNDGFPDLLVINNVNSGLNFLYHNNRDGTFSRVKNSPIATDIWSEGAACAAWGDYDNDGLPDLYITDQAGTRCQLYHNDGNGAFSRVTSGPELVPTSGGSFIGCGWGDYDNDGYLDLAVSGNGINNVLFHNNGDGTFTKVPGTVIGQSGGSTVAWVDYDNNGFLDLFVSAQNGSTSQNPARNILYHNEGNANGWLEVKLVGTASNRAAIGAKVRVHATIGGKSLWQLREMNTGGGYNNPPLVAHFGMRDAAMADQVRIEWPSGIVQTLTNVTSNQILTITEHQAAASNAAPKFASAVPSGNGAVNLTVTGAAGFIYAVDGSTDLVHWTKLGCRTNLTGAFSFADSGATDASKRFYRASIP